MVFTVDFEELTAVCMTATMLLTTIADMTNVKGTEKPLSFFNVIKFYGPKSGE